MGWSWILEADGSEVEGVDSSVEALQAGVDIAGTFIASGCLVVASASNLRATTTQKSRSGNPVEVQVRDGKRYKTLTPAGRASTPVGCLASGIGNLDNTSPTRSLITPVAPPEENPCPITSKTSPAGKKEKLERSSLKGATTLPEVAAGCVSEGPMTFHEKLTLLEDSGVKFSLSEEAAKHVDGIDTGELHFGEVMKIDMCDWEVTEMTASTSTGSGTAWGSLSLTGTSATATGTGVLSVGSIDPCTAMSSFLHFKNRHMPSISSPRPITFVSTTIASGRTS